MASPSFHRVLLYRPFLNYTSFNLDSTREMLLHQAFAQFRFMTDRDLPPALGRKLLGLDDVESGAEEDGAESTGSRVSEEDTV